jgi:3-oxoacyl-[acyl-carrier-protein] synthase-3
MKWSEDMGTQIKMVSVARPRFGLHHVNSIRLAARAARQCLDDAGIDPFNLELLINTGVYRHKNTGEPAIAALIQEKITANDPVKNISADSGNTFSFDINNGGCGLLTGLEIVNRAISNGDIACGMVVTSDTEPFYGLSEDFNINSAAAAVLLDRSENSKGFSMFRTYTFPEYSEELLSCSFYGKSGWLRKNRNRLNIMQKESFPDIGVDCSVKSLLNFLDELNISPDEIDLIIPSQSPLGFTGMLRKRLGMNGSLIELEKTGNMVFHTAGPAIALKKVWDNNRFQNSGNVIFLTIGSGINVSLTLYKN